MIKYKVQEKSRWNILSNKTKAVWATYAAAIWGWKPLGYFSLFSAIKLWSKFSNQRRGSSIDYHGIRLIAGRQRGETFIIWSAVDVQMGDSSEQRVCTEQGCSQIRTAPLMPCQQLNQYKNS